MACTQSESPVNQCGGLARQTADGRQLEWVHGAVERWSGCWPDSQAYGGRAVVMAMTASGLTALGLSHIRHSVKLLFAIAIKGGVRLQKGWKGRRVEEEEEQMGSWAAGQVGSWVHGHFKLAPCARVCSPSRHGAHREHREHREEAGGTEVSARLEVTLEQGQGCPPSMATLKLKLSIVLCRLHWTRGRLRTCRDKIERERVRDY